MSESRQDPPGTAMEVPDSLPVARANQPGSAAGTIASGILTSRIAGFLRERAVAHFFGVGAHADVLQVAFRGPNLLQNLLGEGTISAAFIPIYSRMIEEGRAEEAGRFAGAIFGLLLTLAAGLSLLGIVFAQPIVTFFAPGFLDDASKVAAGVIPVNRFELAVQAVRVIFPMVGFLVLSAWCLGVLNSHRRFFLPYFAPVIWNAAIIAGLFAAAYAAMGAGADAWAPESIATESLNRVLFGAFFGALVGGMLQFAIQLPLVLRLLKGFRVRLSLAVEGVRTSLRAFGPVVAGRGVYQLSSYLDLVLASFLAAGAVSSLRYAQMLYILPVSLFGLSVAASELPELSRFSKTRMDSFMLRIHRSLGQMLFMTIPTLVCYVAFGYLIIGAIFRTGQFGTLELWLVYFVLGSYSLGLLATTTSRLLQNAFYALNDTKTPAKIAAVRVMAAVLIAVPLMTMLDRFSVSDVVGIATVDGALFMGSVGLALGTAVGAWVELWRLKRALSRRVEDFHLPWRRVRQIAATAAFATVPGAVVWLLLPPWHIALQALAVLLVYGFVYFGASMLQQAPEVGTWTERWFGK